MPEPTIIRTQVVVVADRDVSQYGDTIFHDGEGNEFKLGKKRAHLSDQIVEGHAVQIGWANYMNKDYIATVKLVEGKLPPPVKPKPVESANPPEEEVKAAIQAKINPQERGMWWKELGEMLRSSDIDKTTKHGKALRIFFYSEMYRVLDIDIKDE